MLLNIKNLEWLIPSFLITTFRHKAESLGNKGATFERLEELDDRKVFNNSVLQANKGVNQFAKCWL